MEIFGQRLAALRHETGKKLREVGSAIGFSLYALSDWERGKSFPDFSTLVCIARYYHVSTDYLLGLTDERKPRWTQP